jgi:hypothetical protein
MMFRLGQTPSPRANAVELADYVEIECLRQSDRNASIEDLLRDIGRISEDSESDREAADAEVDDIVLAVGKELADRAGGTGPDRRPYRYPFSLDPRAEVLALKRRFPYALYLFLLLATRLNMRDNRVHAGIDGANLFEVISGEVARSFWGPRARSFVFGTSRRVRGHHASFQAAVGDLCANLKEGRQFENRYGQELHAQDDALDLAVWSPFEDGCGGQLIGFGQCKTGTSWDDADVRRLQPRGFVGRWFEGPVPVEPVALFFVTQRIERSK